MINCIDNYWSEQEPSKQTQEHLDGLDTESQISDLSKRLFQEELIDVQKITEWPKEFIRIFSASLGNNKEFLIGGKFPGDLL